MLVNSIQHKKLILRMLLANNHKTRVKITPKLQ